MSRRATSLSTSLLQLHRALPSSSTGPLLPWATLSLRPRTPRSPTRSISTSTPRLQKASVALIAALRKERPVPIGVAREALEHSSNDLAAAIAYLDGSSSHASKKAEKVGGRDTLEGVIAISLLGGKRVGMVQVGCETDFVARNEVFLKTARSIAGTAAFLDVPDAPPEGPPMGGDPILDFPTDALLSAPLIALPPPGESAPSTTPTTDVSTVSQTLLASLGQTGENLRLLRAVSFAAPFPSTPLVRYVPGAYVHGGGATEGKVGGVVVLSVESADDTPMAGKIHGAGGDELEKGLSDLARTVARQVVGFPTKAIRKGDNPMEESEVLLEQPAMMFGQDLQVGKVLEAWGAERGVRVSVAGMRRWAVGEPIAGAGDHDAPPPPSPTEKPVPPPPTPTPASAT